MAANATNQGEQEMTQRVTFEEWLMSVDAPEGGWRTKAQQVKAYAADMQATYHQDSPTRDLEMTTRPMTGTVQKSS